MGAKPGYDPFDCRHQGGAVGEIQRDAADLGLMDRIGRDDLGGDRKRKRELGILD